MQWRVPRGTRVEPRSERRLFEDGQFFHPDGRARFLFAEPTALPEATCEQLPFVLLTGRASSSQWHTLTRTGKSSVLAKLGAREPYVEINPVDAVARGISPGELVMIESRRGRMTARAFVTHTVQPGQVFVPMHYARTNQLTRHRSIRTRASLRTSGAPSSSDRCRTASCPMRSSDAVGM